jgi:3',5'-cyclic-AMP phosphodiesterase
MYRRDFLKWLTGISVSTVAVIFGVPNVVFSPIRKIAQTQVPQHNVQAKDNIVRIAILSDLHIQDPARSKVAYHYNAKAEKAIVDVLSNKPDLVLVVGDITHHGFKEEYEIAKRLFQPFRDRHIPVHVTMGNHEFYNNKVTDSQALELFMKEFELPTPYHNIVQDSVHLILLSPEFLYGREHARDWARLSADQLNWFKQVLEQHPNIPTFVFLHQPLNDTVEQSQYQDWIARTEQTEQLLAILDQHRQVKCWFSGHTHAPLENKNQVVYRHGIWFFGGSSTYYTNDIMPKNGKRTGPFLGRGFQKKINFRASQSRFVTVYPDKIVVQARDHEHKQWMKDLEYVVPLTSPESVRQKRIAQ